VFTPVEAISKSFIFPLSEEYKPFWVTLKAFSSMKKIPFLLQIRD